MVSHYAHTNKCALVVLLSIFVRFKNTCLFEKLLNIMFNNLVFLIIAVPPNSPRVISEDGHIDTTGAIAGVYQEDEPMRLKCEVVGGRSSLKSPMQRQAGPVQHIQT